MLEHAFYESPDYKTLIETSDRPIVVGRRGTGKSALLFKLKSYLSSADRTVVAEMVAEEDQIIGLRPLIQLFGESFRLVRSGSRTVWRYAFLIEIACVLIKKYKAEKLHGYEFLQDRTREWLSLDYSVCGRVKALLEKHVDAKTSVESRIGNLSRKLKLKELEEAIHEALEKTRFSAVLLIDKLDEGYEPDDLGIGLVDGLVQAAVDINSQFSEIRIVVFLRDNIFRSIAKEDPDFSRDIEGQVLRLHWDEYALFNLATARLQTAFHLNAESSIKIWNRCVTGSLDGKDGFRLCLRSTLYRPRDVLNLLNEAFLTAGKQNRDRIIETDISGTSKSISDNRLNDLRKEYSAIFPGLSEFAAAFTAQSAEQSYVDAVKLIQTVMLEDRFSPSVQQTMAILRSPVEALTDLYSVGFLGIKDELSGDYVFCHDGRRIARDMNEKTVFLVHPCYWGALNLAQQSFDERAAQQIYDEYDIEVSSENPVQRSKRLSQLMAVLNEIPLGREGAEAFEDWCLQAIRIVFAGGLRNIQLHPNGTAIHRRDVVGTNLGETLAWKRIYEDRKCRQVIFEIKNYKSPKMEDYRQILSYLTDDYGKLAFIVTRDDDHILRDSSGELGWMKELERGHGVLIIKITGRLLYSLLGKLRNPQKHDHAEKVLLSILDEYVRVYLSASSMLKRKRGKK